MIENCGHSDRFWSPLEGTAHGAIQFALCPKQYGFCEVCAVRKGFDDLLKAAEMIDFWWKTAMQKQVLGQPAAIILLSQALEKIESTNKRVSDVPFLVAKSAVDFLVSRVDLLNDATSSK